MGGLGIFGWIAIGTIASWTVTRLMVGADDDALRGTAAGMIGAVLAGLGMRLLESRHATHSGGVNTLFAALAGSLWMTWITCVATSGREPRREPPPATEPRLTGADAVPIG
jgi:uncharacterized membrane protein YeaQ/YmgE (transglycosylase-associated protein family)